MMVLQKKTRYAMLALTRLAKEYGNGVLLSTEISKSEKIPQRFLENILHELKKKGIVGSRQGKNGGYYLLHDPKTIKLVTIIQHFEGMISIVHCVSENEYHPCEFCKDEKRCKLRKVFKTIRDNTYHILEETSIHSLIFSE